MIFNPVFSSWLIILIVILLSVFLLWQEWRKPYRFRVFRIIAVLLMMIALMGMLLKPGYQVETSSSIILLTEDFAENDVDSILSINPRIVVMHLEGTRAYKNSKRLDAHDLDKYSSEIKVVVGQGLPRYYLDMMSKKAFDYFAAAVPEGIIDLSVPPYNVAGRKNTITGTMNSRFGNVWISLLGPGGKEDSVQIQKKGQSHFELTFTPKHEGEFVYTISIRDSSNSYQEALPVHVEKERNLNILFLQSYPTFETHALKNFLASKNHSIVLRSQVSKNNFRYEYVNREPIQANRLSSELLEDTDLLITDEDVLSALTSGEKNILVKYIQAGLGLLNLSTNEKSTTFFPFETNSTKVDTAAIRIGSESFTFPAPRIGVIPNAFNIPLQKNKSGLLSGYTFHGAGKIGFQLLQETYRLSLSGDSLAYSELWTPLLEHIARSDYETSKINISTPFPWYENEPIDLEVISPAENISILDDSITLPLKEDITIDNVWHARTWAGKPGWHKLETDDGSSLHYYVAPSTGWKSLSLNNQQNANKLAKREAAQHDSKKNETWEEFPPLWFYLMFILSAGFIWLAPKL